MPTPDKPTSKRHYFKMPKNISKMTDAEIDAFAAELYERLMSVISDSLDEDKKGNQISRNPYSSKDT